MPGRAFERDDQRVGCRAERVLDGSALQTQWDSGVDVAHGGRRGVGPWWVEAPE